VLRVLGSAYRHLWETHEQVLVVGDTPIQAQALPYLALVAIEVANDHRKRRFGDADLLEAAEVFNHLGDPFVEEGGDDASTWMAYLLRLGQHNFHHQAEMRHLFPRTMLMLRDVWGSTPEASAVDPLEDLRSMTGMTLEQIMWIGKACAALPNEGYLRPSMMRFPGDEHPQLGSLLTEDACKLFFKWASATYLTIRQEAARFKPPSASYDHYRFNPLAIYPLVRPDVNPDPSNGPVYLVPCRRLIVERVTLGLYHDLAKHYASTRSAVFKNAFGHVFQNYVGLLLREALPGGGVNREWKYGPSSNVRDTPDWIIIEGTRAVLIEVKQSALFLETKMWGQVTTLRSDMQKTLGKALRQLASFEVAIDAGTPGLERMKSVSEYERLVVCFDSVHWGNSVVRDEMTAIARQDNVHPVHVHVAAIQEFEYVLGRCWHGSLFDLLRRKRTGDGGQDAMDFKDWMGHYPVGVEEHGNPFLSAAYNELSAEVGLPPVPLAAAQAAAGGDHSSSDAGRPR
jgi:hypothetical protein